MVTLKMLGALGLLGDYVVNVVHARFGLKNLQYWKIITIFAASMKQKRILVVDDEHING